MQTNPCSTNKPRLNKPSGTARTSDETLGDYPHRFKVYLEGQGYKPATVVGHVRCVNALAQLMQQHGIALGDLNEAAAAGLFAQADSRSYPRGVAKSAVKGFVRFLIEQGVRTSAVATTPPATGRAELRRGYEDYLRHERGLSERTIPHCWWDAERFLKFRFGEEQEKLAAITPADLAQFLQQMHSGAEPYRVKTLSTHLRSFFRYLFKVGKTDTNLALSVPKVAHRYGQRLPRHLTPEQVETLLAAVRSGTPTSRRDYAMVLLLARLGLRAPEVIAIQLDDLDWRSGELIVRGKGERHDRVPLPPDVGQAITDYVRLDRVTTCRTLFVTDRAPHRPFKDGQVLNTILRDAFAKTGLKPPAPYVGSHILRHSLATNLVQRGASLEEIADLLRHRSRGSTMIYAKVDIAGLRSIAQPWPTTRGAQ